MEYDYREAMKLSNQLCFPLYAASRIIISLYTHHLKEFGITYTQYIVFLVLWEQDGITVGDICERLMLDNTSDDRVVLISLTEEGRSMQEKLRDIPATIAGCVSLPPDKAKTLYELLYQLLNNQNNQNNKSSNRKGYLV